MGGVKHIVGSGSLLQQLPHVRVEPSRYACSSRGHMSRLRIPHGDMQEAARCCCACCAAVHMGMGMC